jgi:hypothetical protein
MREISTRDMAILRHLDERKVRVNVRVPGERQRKPMPISAEQLKRWRSWRGVGFIPRSPERIRGYRPGIEIPPRELLWIEQAAELISRYRDADLAALLLAARGFAVDAEAVKDAFLDYFDSTIAPRERASSAETYRRIARTGGVTARYEEAAQDAFARLGVEPPTPRTDERPVEAIAAHRRNVLVGTEPASGAEAITLAEARAAIDEVAAPEDVVVALRMACIPADELRGLDHAVDYIARGLVTAYREAFTA